MGKARMKEHVRRPKVCDPMSPRLLAVIDFFASMPGGVVQIDMEKLSEVTGIPIASLKRHVSWAARYGAIRKENQYAFGQGRMPTIYTSLISLEEWVGTEEKKGVGPAKVLEYQENAPGVRAGGRKAAPKKEKRKPPPKVGLSWADVQ